MPGGAMKDERTPEERIAELEAEVRATAARNVELEEMVRKSVARTAEMALRNSDLATELRKHDRHSDLLMRTWTAEEEAAAKRKRGAVK